MLRFLVAVSLLAALTACTKPVQNYADDATIAAVAYRNPEPPSLTLYTMVNNRSGEGAHTALLINASQQVIFDPAGSFYSSATPEQDDVIFGVTPQMEQAYRSAHARSTFHVVSQKVSVSPEQAERALQLARSNGRVADAFCASSTAKLLTQIPGFESIRSTMFPKKLMTQFAEIPGVQTDRYYEDDSPDLQQGLNTVNATLTQ
ncbi:hypothetical protein I5535_04050 [Rhodobacteraceae bacterium F11138]|nr:hypothetical protein [Rhodobacteraceae bacterium F11138]